MLFTGISTQLTSTTPIVEQRYEHLSIIANVAIRSFSSPLSPVLLVLIFNLRLSLYILATMAIA